LHENGRSRFEAGEARPGVSRWLPEIC
jgi:hypothetical protein